jgi:HSP20 family protein
VQRLSDSASRLLRFRQALEQLLESTTPGPADSLAGGPPVPLDILVYGEHVELLFELPGVRPEDLEVSVISGRVLVEGYRTPSARPPGSLTCLERPAGRFRRGTELPVPVDTRRAVASLENGLLRVHVPRIADRRGAAHPIPVIRP